ncbi:MAG: hypothetical protein LPK00_04025 [Bacillaceae bacterium]|nr:hypothetical protein [Bacillaceae bacterium]
MEEMLKAILTEVQGVNKRLGSLENKFDGLENRFDGLENRFDLFETKIEEKIDNLGSEMRSNFRYLENKIDEHTRNFEIIAEDLKNSRIDFNYLNSKVANHEVRINNIEKRLEP